MRNEDAMEGKISQYCQKKEKEWKKLKGKTRNVGKRRMKEYNKGMEEEKEGRKKIREKRRKKKMK